MRVYEVYYWNPDHGERVRFFGSEGGALKYAKKIGPISETAVTISRIEMPTSKSGLVLAINSVRGTKPMMGGEEVAEIDGGGQ
jgi:hypothetical protein